MSSVSPNVSALVAAGPALYVATYSVLCRGMVGRQRPLTLMGVFSVAVATCPALPGVRGPGRGRLGECGRGKDMWCYFRSRGGVGLGYGRGRVVRHKGRLYAGLMMSASS